MDNTQIKDKYIGVLLDERYEILERIGSGGMALVYKARCHKLDRFVAVKILKDELAIDEEFRERFQNESKAVAMLSHTNIVNVYDVSRSTNPDYIVMEYIEGLTLKEYMVSRGGALTWKESLHFTAQITKALIHAHNKGIIHRDIKPQNIMLLHDSSVKVTDFGIARLATKSNTLTKDTLGSVHYISPEQAKGSPVDKRTDIYSLGVVLYEMLTGRLPFEGENSVAIALQHFTSTPLSPRELNSEIPKGLETIVLKMMAPDLTKRYKSADELFEDLETFRRHPETEFDYEDLAASVTSVVDYSIPNNVNTGKQQPITAKTDKKAERREYNESVKRSRRNVVLVCIALVLITIVGIVVFLWNSIGEYLIPSEGTPLMIPDWENMPYENIINDDQYIGFFTFSKRTEYSDTVKEGWVIKQDLPAGERKYEPSGTVNDFGQALPEEPFNVVLTVSSGNETLEMPDFVTNNYEYRDAEIKLRDMGLSVETEFEINDTVTKDYVFRTEPVAGEVVRPGDTVILYVSEGPQIVYITVPGLKGRMISDAEIIIENMNLTIGDKTAVKNDRPYGEVIGQSPAENTDVPEHTRVDLMISDGSGYVDPSATPEPTPTDEPPEVTVEPSSDPGDQPTGDPITEPSGQPTDETPTAEPPATAPPPDGLESPMPSPSSSGSGLIIG